MENKFYFTGWPHRNYLSYEKIRNLFAKVSPHLAAVLVARRSIKKERRNKARRNIKQIF